MLSLCFMDFIGWDYDVAAPRLRPLGGSQSALCYLAIELAKLGHDITVASDTSRPRVVSGVTCLNRKSCNRQFFADRKFDAVIVLNGPAGRSELRQDLPPSTMLILWTGHAADEVAMRKLSLRDTCEKWDRIVCVSDWHRRSFIDAFGLDPTRVSVMRNAIAPAFEGLFASRGALVAAKSRSKALRLAYTSTPFRGLHLLLSIFPAFRSKHPDARLEVYSSMAVYRDAAADQGRYRPLYDALKATAGVKYFGSLAQPALAERLARAHILSYPNIFAETSCISVMEALAAGLLIVTSDLGALSETTEGFARLVPIDLDKPPAVYLSAYRDALARPYSLSADADRLYGQVVHMNQHCTWRVRARQWTELLQLRASAAGGT